MRIVDKMLIRQAIELSAVIGDHSDTMFHLTNSFLKTEYGLEFSAESIDVELERESTARLFFACAKERPEDIKNPYNCLRLARDLWLDYFIATSDLHTEQEFLEVAESKFQQEKQLKSTLEASQTPLAPTIKRLFAYDGDLRRYRNQVRKTTKYFKVAFFVLDEFFSRGAAKPFFDIYNPFAQSMRVAETKQVADKEISALEEKGTKREAGQAIDDGKPEEKTKQTAMDRKPEEKAEQAAMDGKPEGNAEQAIDKEADEKKNTHVTYLEKTIHDLKVKLEHTQKDAVRDMVLTLASRGYGSPLYELYLIQRDETTPGNVSSAISNLFLALESLDIRLAREHLVGRQMQYGEIEEGKYILQGNEVLEPGDSVRVKYPGLRLGKEMIVKPTIVKEN